MTELTSKDYEYIREGLKKASESEHDQIIRFFTSCCKHCRMADLGCSAGMGCMCHDEQIDDIKAKLEHSSQSLLSKFEDEQECTHYDMTDFDDPIGDKLAESGIDSVYITCFHCQGCNFFVKEVYNYEGIETI